MNKKGIRNLSQFLLGEPLFHLGFLKVIGEFIDVAVHDALHIVGGVVDAVIGDAGLGEVVGADLLGTVAGANEGFPLSGVAFLRFALGNFEELGAEDLEGLFLILSLGSTVL